MTQMNNQIVLDFKGPYKFTQGENYLFNSEYAKSEGVYLWIIKVKKTNRNYVHYIGETKTFGKRHREHFIHTVGLNYGFIDAKLATEGIVKWAWRGMWRDRSTEAISNVILNYEGLSRMVIEYLNIINIYFAPTKLDRDIRKHVEGSIGYNLRNNYPEYKLFYADDNHIGMKETPINMVLKVILPEPVDGIDNEIMI